MLNRILSKILFFIALFISGISFAAVDPSDLLEPLEAFAPKMVVSDKNTVVQFTIADGYYLYRSKTSILTTPENVFGEAQFSQGEVKEDKFFGKQEIYRNSAQITLPNSVELPIPTVVNITFQGCADVGICYPPHNVTFTIKGTGVFQPDNAVKKKKRTSLFFSQDNSPNTNDNSLSERTLLGANLLAFFVAGVVLSFSACMYPLLPIVSATVLGKEKLSKKRALLLSFSYVQGLALTYTVVGVIAALTGSLLTVWLQRPVVILTAAFLLVVLALSMFGWFQIQMPSSIQQFFSEKSNRHQGGKIIAVFLMGIFSALIIGPCAAPPLMFVLGYIGQSGDILLGASTLYVLALGLGLPLMAVSVFGAHFLPRAGAWMRAVQVFFGCLLLSAAVFIATPFLPREVVIACYAMIFLIPGGWLLARFQKFSGRLKTLSLMLGSILIVLGFSISYIAVAYDDSLLHRSLHLPKKTQQITHKVFTTKSELEEAIELAFSSKKEEVVLVDFYADWCVSCREMADSTLKEDIVWQYIDKERFFTFDVTLNTDEQQDVLREYGLFGPPGLFVLTNPNNHGKPLIGFVKSQDLIDWVKQQKSAGKDN